MAQAPRQDHAHLTTRPDVPARIDFVALSYWVRKSLLVGSKIPPHIKNGAVENGIFEGYVNSGLTTIASVEELIDVINLPRAPDSEFQDGISPRLAFKKLFTSLKRHNPTKIVVKWTAEEAYKRCLASFAQDSYHLVTPTKKLSAEQLQVAKAKFLAMPVKLAPSRWNRS